MVLQIMKSPLALAVPISLFLKPQPFAENVYCTWNV